MKRALSNDLRLILAVLVLAAAAVDLLLPSPHCKDPGIDSQRISGSGKAAGACAVSFPAADNGLREP